MARRRSFSRGRSRSSGRRSYSSFSRGRRTTSRRRSSRGRSGRSQAVRIIIEQPGANQVSRPGIPGMPGIAQDLTPPKKARF